MRKRFGWRFGIPCDVWAFPWGHFKEGEIMGWVIEWRFHGIFGGPPHGLPGKESMPGIPPHRMSLSTAEEVDIPRPKQSDLRCLFQNAGELSLSRVLYATSSVMFNHGFSHILQISPLFVPLHKYKTMPQIRIRNSYWASSRPDVGLLA